MNKIGVCRSYWLNDWESNVKDYVTKVSNLGFNILEVDAGIFLDMTEQERNEIKDLLKKENIELTFTTSLDESNNISSPDKLAREKGVEYLKRIVEVINYMGGKKLGGVYYGIWGTPMNITKEDKKTHLENSIKSMKKVIKSAEDYNVTCNVEVVNRFEQFMLNTCDEGLDYVKRVDSPNIMLLLDTYHMNIEEDSIKEAIIKAGDKLGHLHLGENNRKPPGQGGHMNWEEVIEAINEANYKKALVMECFIQPWGEIGNDIKVWRNLKMKTQDMDKAIKKARIFIQDKLQ